MSETNDKPPSKPVFRKDIGYARDRSAIPHGSVALDWSDNPTGEMAAWASCFHAAAETLVRDFSTQEEYADREACPIVFLYRHALELCLKALLLEAITLMQAEGEEPAFSEKLLSKHNLSPLVPPLKDTFVRFNHSLSLDGRVCCSYDGVRALAEELDLLDSGSYAFRYPLTKSFRSPFLPHHLRIDVFELCRRSGIALAGLQELVTRVNLEICRYLDNEEEEIEE